MGVNSLPKTVTRQRRDCDLNPGSSEPESSTLTTRLPSHPYANALYILSSCVCQSACPSIRHKTVLYRNDWMNRAVLARDLSHTVL